MGRTKALLPIANTGETFVERIVRTLVAGGVDGVVLVVRWGRTTTPAAEDAAESLRAASARLLGTVLTMIRGSRLRRLVRDDAILPSHTEYVDKLWAVPPPRRPLPEPGDLESPAPPAPPAPALASSGQRPPSPRPRPRPQEPAPTEDNRTS